MEKEEFAKRMKDLINEAHLFLNYKEMHKVVNDAWLYYCGLLLKEWMEYHDECEYM